MKLTDRMEQSTWQSIRLYMDAIKRKRDALLVAAIFLFSAFFLSQAVLFDAAVPFFLPVWALVYIRFRKYLLWVFIGGIAGSMLLGLGQAVIHLLEIVAFTFALKYSFSRKSIPITVASTVLLIQLLWQFLMHGGAIPIEVQFFIGFEVILSLFLTLFLFMAFPSADRLLFGNWTPERLGATCIVGVMAITGMTGFVIGQVALSNVFIHLLLLVAAYIGGIPFAVTVGMIVAAIIGLAELSFTGMMTVYGMTGFLAGAFQKLGRIGIAIGAGLVSLFFFMYDLTLPLDSTYFVSIGVGTLLFFLIPSKKLLSLKKSLQPDHKVELKRHQWMTERLDEQLKDFQQFSQFMSTLVSGKDNMYYQKLENSAEPTPSVCQSCFRYAKCWEGESTNMGHLIQSWKSHYSFTKKASRHQIEEKIKYKCIRFKGLIEELEENTASNLLNEQLQHGRQMLALQLRDMSTHLDQVMHSIKEDISVYQPAEEEIARRLEEVDVAFLQIDVLGEEPGNRKVIFCLPEKKSDFERDVAVAERLIVPILEGYYNEPFKVEKTMIKETPFPYMHVTITSDIRFSMDYGVVMVAGNETLQMGDAYDVFSIHDGLVAVLLSDGMGQDAKAYHESRKVIRLMRECLNRKMNPETAMHTLHYMMTLNGLDDMYATLDLALLDLQDGRLWAWKAGSMSTYIMRGDDFLRVDSESIPIGFAPSPSIETKNERLKSGDIIVMLTDGVFHNDVPIQFQEKVIYDILEQYQQSDCEHIAEKMMNELERKFKCSGDDRTVLVLKIEHVLPKWKSFTPYTIG